MPDWKWIEESPLITNAQAVYIGLRRVNERPKIFCLSWLMSQSRKQNSWGNESQEWKNIKRSYTQRAAQFFNSTNRVGQLCPLSLNWLWLTDSCSVESIVYTITLQGQRSRLNSQTSLTKTYLRLNTRSCVASMTRCQSLLLRNK